MSRAEAESVMQAYREALERHDPEAAMALIADDAPIHVNGRNALSGSFSDKAHMLQTYEWVFSEFDGGIDVTQFHDVLVSEDHAVALIEERAHRGPAVIRYRRFVIAHVRDGKISELWLTTEDPYALDEFWA
jgi:ketosteroid isomerase-like protein